MKKSFFIIIFFLLFPMFANSQDFTLKPLADFDLSHSGGFAFDANEKTFFVMGKDAFYIRSLENFEEIYSTKDKIKDASYSPNGKYLVMFLSKEVRFFNLETKEIKVVSFKNKVRFLNWSDDGKKIAVADDKFVVSTVETQTASEKTSFQIYQRKKLRISRFFDSVQSFTIQAEFIPYSEKILTICGDEKAKVWNTETGRLLYEFQHLKMNQYDDREIYYGKVSSDGKWIITATYDHQRLWNAADGKMAAEFVGYGHPSFSPDSKYLGLLNDPDGDRAVKLMDLQTLKVKTLLNQYAGEISVWSNDSKTFITDRTIDERSKNMANMWDVSTGKQIASFKTYSKSCFDPVSTCLSDFDIFSFNPNGNILVSVNDKQANFLNPQDGKLLKTSEKIVSRIVWSKSGNYFLSKIPKQSKVGLWELSF